MAKPTQVRGLHAATPMPEAARALLAGRLADVQRQLGKLGGALAADPVHDARVATRRLRAALVLFGEDRRVRRADRIVSALQDALGEVRDLHVQINAFAAMGGGTKEKFMEMAKDAAEEYFDGDEEDDA